MSKFYTHYPANWKEISLAIRRDRAQWCCEWCGVSNGVEGARDMAGKFHSRQEIGWLSVDDFNVLFGTDAYPHSLQYVTIVLTVAHLGVPYPDGRPGNKHDKSDCRPENLAALCQRCHLNFDRADHLARAAATRERKRRERDAARGWVQGELAL